MKNRLQGMIIGLILGIGLSTAVLAAPVSKMISVVYDAYKIRINGEDKTDISPDMKLFNYEGRMYVPLRYVAEALHMTVKWDGDTKTVYIDDSDMQEFVLTPQEEISKEELTACVQIIDMRLKQAEIPNYTLSVYDNTIIVSVSDKVSLEDIENCLVKGYLNLRDSKQNIILDKKDIQKAYACYDDLTRTGIRQHYVEILLTETGREKLAEASREIAKRQNNQNYIAIMVDDIVYSTPFVTEEIDGDRIDLTGYFTQNSAKELAAVLSTVELPVQFWAEKNN